MTDDERELEYLTQERLGILCGSNDPTPEQIELATNEARETLERMKE